MTPIRACSIFITPDSLRRWYPLVALKRASITAGGRQCKNEAAWDDQWTSTTYRGISDVENNLLAQPHPFIVAEMTVYLSYSPPHCFSIRRGPEWHSWLHNVASRQALSASIRKPRLPPTSDAPKPFSTSAQTNLVAPTRRVVAARMLKRHFNQ